MDPTGLFVTNAHVVEGGGPGVRIKLVLRSGEEDQKIIGAKIYRRDEMLDLALLKADPVPGLTALALAREEDLYRDAGDDRLRLSLRLGLGLRARRLPECECQRAPDQRAEESRRGSWSSSSSTASSTRATRVGRWSARTARSIGVAEATLTASGINFAIPVGQLARFLAVPGWSSTRRR